MHEAHTLIALALGGEAGSRLAKSLAMATSPDTLLRRIENLPLSRSSPIRVLGVDDWAWRRGHHYGTILCDLERRCPVDLLRGRSAQALRDWLAQHPEIQIITRDRADDYIKGATDGAPQAVQVADRWHLLRNLRDSLMRTLDRLHAVVQDSQSSAAEPLSSMASLPNRATAQRYRARSESRRAQRLQRFQEVKRLHEQGIPQRAIAKRLGIHRGTVRRFIRASSFPERAGRRSGCRTDNASTRYLKRRWKEGCRNAALLAKELAARGIDRSYYSVRRQVSQWRERGAVGSAAAARPIKRYSCRRAAWLLLKEKNTLQADEQDFIRNLEHRSSELQTTAELAREFSDMVRQRKSKTWDGWVAKVRSSGPAKELQRFADALQQDEAAVKAALTLQWSNGQVEGQVNRLKMLKRQMYGRAGFDLLRRRVLLAK